MATGTEFDAAAMAKFYARRHLKIDKGVRLVNYLPAGAGEREIRLLEVNELIAAEDDSGLTPLDFGVNTGAPDGHTLAILDVTPGQWERIRAGRIGLPPGWSLEGLSEYRRRRA